MEQAARGKKALVAGNYEEAIAEYTAALQITPTSPDYLIQRATAYQRAKKYAESLADANSGVLNAQKRAKRELIIEAQFRRGCALFSLERYGDAEFVFGIVKRMDEKHKMLPMWAHKTKMSLDKLDKDDEKRKCTVKETPEAMEAGGASSAGGAASTNGAHSSPAQGHALPTTTQQTPPDKIRHEWYQSTEKVYFTLLAKGVPKDQAQVDIKERSLTISFPLTTGSSFDFTLDPLFAPVKPEKCIPRILPTKIEVILMKATPGQKWSALEGKEQVSAGTESTVAGAEGGQDDAVKATVVAESKPTGPMYPTSSKSGPKDWDKIANDLRKPDDDGKESSSGDRDDYEGGDEANFFFQKLYKDLPPDAQRAMKKSFTESNGTVLSTNWDEVSKGPVETSPPDGMEERKW